MPSTNPREAALRVEDLAVFFHTEGGLARAVDGVSFSLERGRTLALVGESGSGKSVTALALLRLHSEPPAEIARGRVWLGERDLLRLPKEELRAVRGREMAMIFQEPMSSLNPLLTIGAQVAEGLVAHGLLGRRAAAARAVELLDRVGIPEPAARARAYPHELSGGMRQRALIAMALACEPRVLLADEPTTALDTTVQAQILELLREQQRSLGLALLLVTHDFGVVSENAHAVAVMYAGQIVERAETRALLATPRHPYTQGLLASVPRLFGPLERLQAIPGSVLPATAWPSGCRFRTRCALAHERCAVEEPALRSLTEEHAVACHAVT
ncbi:MAG: ABC transporter ATP-binding protein [Planctomycetes bacterium]|nr:ABC transporter ATP-binding protein [Planctomycetota bacterium]